VADHVIFERLQSSPPLRDIVESIWLQEHESPEDDRIPSCVLPTGTVEILFHYGDRFSHVEPGGIEQVPRSYVTAQRTRTVFTLAPSRVGIVIVSLFPWGMSALFPECTGTTDGYVDLALLCGASRIAALEERLCAAEDAATRIGLVESFLLSWRSEGAGGPRMIAASRMAASMKSPCPVHELANRFSMSRRHFARTFRSTIGIQPKTFSRIMRFQKAMTLRRDEALSLSSIAAECWYTDQAHMSHEIKQLSGRNPGQIRLRREHADDVFNGNAGSSFFGLFLSRVTR
jgi:AraC-like DNA-binding protein